MKRKFILISVGFFSLILSNANAGTPIAPADILGRDLLVPGLSWMGHVGLGSFSFSNDPDSPGQVIEALNDTPVIQINTVTDFKSRSKYWGSRYGITKNLYEALLILVEAEFQRLRCPQYTLTAESIVGQTDAYGNTTQCAKFRCDTFINYVYHAGGHDLPTYNNLTYPRRVFESFPFGNYDGASFNQQKSVSHNSNFEMEAISLSQLIVMDFSEFTHFIDLMAAEKKSYMTQRFWEYAKDSNLESQKRIYILDYLGSLGDAELLPELVELYPNENDLALKNMILQASQDLYQRHHVTTQKQDLKKLLQHFYFTLLSDDLTSPDAAIVIRGYVALSPEKIILNNVDKIQRILESPRVNMHPYVKLGLKLQLMSKSKDIEDIIFSDILNMLEQHKDFGLENHFINTLVNRLRGAGVDGLSKSSKNMAHDYLETIQESYSHPYSNNNSYFNLVSYGGWLEASSLLKASSQEEANDLIAEKIKEKNLMEQSIYIIGLSNSPQMRESLQNEPIYKEILYNSIQKLHSEKSNQAKIRENAFIKLAVTRLNKLQKNLK